MAGGQGAERVESTTDKARTLPTAARSPLVAPKCVVHLPVDTIGAGWRRCATTCALQFVSQKYVARQLLSTVAAGFALTPLVRAISRCRRHSGGLDVCRASTPPLARWSISALCAAASPSPARRSRRRRRPRRPSTTRRCADRLLPVRVDAGRASRSSITTRCRSRSAGMLVISLLQDRCSRRSREGPGARRLARRTSATSGCCSRTCSDCCSASRCCRSTSRRAASRRMAAATTCPTTGRAASCCLSMIFVLSSFLDNIAAALIGGTIARHRVSRQAAHRVSRRDRRCVERRRCRAASSATRRRR